MNDTVTLAARTALVLETNNLHGGGPGADVAAGVKRAVMALAAQTIPLAGLAQLVVTHDGLDDACRAGVQRLAGREIDFVQVPAGLGYYEAKNAGFAATDERRCDHVVFADSDCNPQPGWLHELLLPLAGDDPPAAVAGRTSYPSTVAGTALTTIDFMYFPSPLRTGATRNFYANNVVFRRDVFEAHRYEALAGVYRAHCQVLGLRLQAAGVALHYAPRAHTEHRLPDTRREALTLRWRRGQDTCGLAPHLVRTYLPAKLQWLARSGPLGPACVLAARLRYSMRALNRQDLAPLRGPRRLAALALIAVFSTIDLAGAVWRGLGIGAARGEQADARALSYHRQ